MRNDFGTRPYKSRFGGRTAMKKGKSAKKQGYKDREDESLGMRTGKNPLRNNLWKLVEMNLMELGVKEKLSSDVRTKLISSR